MMPTGPFQHLGSCEGCSSSFEPWLLPISDGGISAPTVSPEDAIAAAVRKASRPLWLAANALCLALGLLIAAEGATGFMSTGAPPPAAAIKAPVVTASAS